MYLSSIPVETGNNPNRPRPGRMWISNAYRVHQRMCMAFDGKKDERILFRIEGPVKTRRGLRLRVLVQSVTEPDWDGAFHNAPFLIVGEELQVKEMNPDIRAKDRFRFLLRANPTVKKKTDGRKHNPRHALTTIEEQEQWLQRKAETGGFRVVELTIVPTGRRFSRRSKQIDPNPHVHFSVDFSGILEVTDPDEFRSTWVHGIGPAKAYGFGLLSLARA